MVTQKFAKSGPSGEVFITGVTYNDSDGNKFYSIGEGTGGVSVSAGGSGTTTAFAGGYAVLATAGAVTVTFGGTISATVDASQGNVKLDLVGGDTLLTSADTTLGSGAENARVLGAGKIDITGNSLDNALIGNRANNTLRGEDGNDDLIGQAGIDRLIGGAGNDVLLGGGGRLDVLIGGSGDDIHIGGRGRDVHVGGAGADSFVFNGRFGVDRIKDFGDDDVLWIAHGGAAGFRDVMRNHAENVAAGVKISFGKHAIIIEDITKSDLDPSDFRFDDFDFAMV
jgi:Ca2+-binding RTX toxin-like protein